MVDRELLQSMTPEQLDVLAQRARVLQHTAEASSEIGAEDKGRRDWSLRVQVAGTAAEGRRIAEPLLATMTKEWQFIKAQSTVWGEETLEYRVRIKKKTDRAEFVGRFRAAAGPTVKKVDFSLPTAG
jgi:hypothetical protein